MKPLSEAAQAMLFRGPASNQSGALTIDELQRISERIMLTGDDPSVIYITPEARAQYLAAVAFSKTKKGRSLRRAYNRSRWNSTHQKQHAKKKHPW